MTIDNDILILVIHLRFLSKVYLNIKYIKNLSKEYINKHWKFHVLPSDNEY